MAKLAGANPDLRDKFRDQLLTTLGAVTANQEAQSGLTDIAETSLSLARTRQRVPVHITTTNTGQIRTESRNKGRVCKLQP